MQGTHGLIDHGKQMCVFGVSRARAHATFICMFTLSALHQAPTLPAIHMISHNARPPSNTHIACHS